MQDDATKIFYVWLGDLSIEKFTKTIYMNLINFAEKAGSSKMILIQDRDHRQKGKLLKIDKIQRNQSIYNILFIFMMKNFSSKT